MRQTLITFITAIAIASPAAAGAQERPIRIQSRLAIAGAQQVPQPARPPRVFVQGRDRDGREEQTETFKKSVHLGSSGEIDISNIAGDITFSRGGGNDATIEVVKIARGRTIEEAKEVLPLVRVEITERGNRAEIRTLYPGQDGNRREGMQNRRNFNVTVQYTITAPAGTRVKAQSVSGSLRVSDITGELSLTSISGSVQVMKARTIASAKSISGKVDISDVDSDAPMEVGSISGDVVMRQVKASRMEIGTVSGSVVLNDVECPRLEAQSLSGNVEFTGALIRSGRYELNSHSGTVKLALASGAGFDLEASSWSGRIETDLPLTGRTHEAQNGRGPRTRSIRGVYGDGSATLEITTFSGNVWIGKR